MYQNINRLNRSLPYINGKINHDPAKKKIHKAPIKRLLEQNTLITDNKPDTYLNNLKVFPDAVELVRNYLEDIVKEIGRKSAKHALKKGRATVMPEDTEYVIGKIKTTPQTRGNKINRTNVWNRKHDHDPNGQYIANIQTKVYHSPDCKKLKNIREKNQIQTNNTQDLYKPCYYCQKEKRVSKDNPTPEWLQKQDHDPEGRYIGNLSTKMYHSPTCHYVTKLMVDEHKIRTDNTQGLYKYACSHCQKTKEILEGLKILEEKFNETIKEKTRQKEDEKRLQKGVELFKKGCVQTNGNNTWTVKGLTNNYTVKCLSGYNWTCNCPDHRHRNTICKHIHAAKIVQIQTQKTILETGKTELKQLEEAY